MPAPRLRRRFRRMRPKARPRAQPVLTHAKPGGDRLRLGGINPTNQYLSMSPRRRDSNQETPPQRVGRQSQPDALGRFSAHYSLRSGANFSGGGRHVKAPRPKVHRARKFTEPESSPSLSAAKRNRPRRPTHRQPRNTHHSRLHAAGPGGAHYWNVERRSEPGVAPSYSQPTSRHLVPPLSAAAGC